MIKVLSSLILIIAPHTLFAAGDSHGGSVWELSYPAFNFLLLFSFLLWKLRRPISEAFDNNAKLIRESYELAEERDKEARLKYEMFRQKLDNFTSESNQILNNVEKDAENFSAQRNKDMNSTIERMKRDIDSKLTHEKNILVQNLNKELVNNIINKTKANIQNDNTLKRRAAQKLLNEI